jgi:uncharacterized membrane protein
MVLFSRVGSGQTSYLVATEHLFTKATVEFNLPFSLNLVGEAAGTAVGGGQLYLASWTASGDRNLVALPGIGFGSVGGENAFGTATGWVELDDGNRSAFYTSGSKTALLAGPNGSPSVGFGINDRNQVAGAWIDPKIEVETDHATVWTDGKPTDLGANALSTSIAVAINDSGEAIGVCEANPGTNNGGPSRIPFTWQNGKVQYLPGLGGYLAEPTALNND